MLTVLIAVLAAVFPAGAQANPGPIVRFATSLGNIDVQLLQNDAPNTVANFLSYVNGGAYANTFFHRSVSGFVIQGGGYQLVNGAIGQITTQAPIGPEIKDSNVRGTLAMALSGNPPNTSSGTDQWFFNLADNSATLDPNFTVFGKVLDPAGLAVMEKIAAEPTNNNGTSCSSCPFDQLPLQNWSAGQAVTNANLIMTPITVLNDTTAPTISISTPADGSEFTLYQGVLPGISCDDDAGTGVASCTATAGTDPSTGHLDTAALGWHTFTVTATDYAGNSATKSVAYQIVPVPGLNFNPPVPSPAPKLAGVLTASTTGAVRFTLKCAAASRCKGRATVYYTAGKAHKKVNIGSTSYSIAGGAHATFSVHLTQRNRTNLRKTKPPVFLQLAPTGSKPRLSRVQLRFTSGK
jgi:cyclophilin family peptidyl-prolyl cis-trans isomerase